MSSEKLSPEIVFPYNIGVVLAVNAIPDAYLVLDGPGCSFYRAMVVHGRHDWTSTLLSSDGHHRFQYAGVNVNAVAADCEAMVRDAIAKVAALPRCAVVLVTSLPMCTVASTDYGRVLREAAAKKPHALVAGSSLSGNWFAGYAATLEAIAQQMDLSGARPAKNKVAIVGNFMDRGEGDHRGNIKEFARLLEALGLELVSCWPSGAPYERLRDLRRAGTLISLPYGRKAAAVLAQRLKVRLIETEVPFGLEASAAWLRKIAKALGKERAAERFIDGELGRIVPRLEWVVPYAFLNKRIVFVGDPHLVRGLRSIAEELGARVSGAFLTGPAPEKNLKDPAIVYVPRVSELRAAWRDLEARDGVDLLISHTDGIAMLKPSGAAMEFGFPSVWTHSLREEPFLGFAGYIAFVDRMANTLTQQRGRPLRRTAPAPASRKVHS
ncbi:MAG: nitrogenase component 1 [Elusimicrobiota bacterium]